MGLKTTNYIVKEMGITLPEAYAYIQSISTYGDKGHATIVVQSSRENAQNMNMRPFEVVDVEFTVDRKKNDRATVYEKVKGSKTIKRFNPKTQETENVEIPEPFFGWENDIQD